MLTGLEVQKSLCPSEKRGEQLICPPLYADIPHTGRDGTTAVPLKGRDSTVFFHAVAYVRFAADGLDHKYPKKYPLGVPCRTKHRPLQPLIGVVGILPT